MEIYTMCSILLKLSKLVYKNDSSQILEGFLMRIYNYILKFVLNGTRTEQTNLKRNKFIGTHSDVQM